VSDYRTIFEAVVSDPRYLANLDWGEARPGHPEGTVRAHIAELEVNLETLRPKLTDNDYWRLRLLVHTHDSFKAQADAGVPISHPKSHASLAREFVAAYCNDVDLLAMVQHHDEPFALYRQAKHKGDYDRERFASLLNAIHDWNVFLAFLLIDGCTAGKSREPLCWFFQRVAGKVDSSFTDAHIIA
jgi:hypothetical protein